MAAAILADARLERKPGRIAGATAQDHCRGADGVILFAGMAALVPAA